jgi:small basic protein (TIGR04137 family)
MWKRLFLNLRGLWRGRRRKAGGRPVAESPGEVRRAPLAADPQHDTILGLYTGRWLMSIDRSLRTQSSLARHRNVLTRAERIQLLLDGDWDESNGALGLPKVAHRKIKAGKKKAEKATTATEAEEPK